MKYHQPNHLLLLTCKHQSHPVQNRKFKRTKDWWVNVEEEILIKFFFFRYIDIHQFLIFCSCFSFQHIFHLIKIRRENENQRDRRRINIKGTPVYAYILWFRFSTSFVYAQKICFVWNLYFDNFRKNKVQWKSFFFFFWFGQRTMYRRCIQSE